MNPNQENDDFEVVTNDTENSGSDDSGSVDEFIRQLEEREKDLHITVDTTIIEIAESFEDGEFPKFIESEFVSRPSPTATLVETDQRVDRSAELEAEMLRLKSVIAKMEDERSEIFQNSQRRAKDFATYKARAERERTETFQNQVGNLATFLLPTLDNFSRAISSAEELNEQQGVEFQRFFEGVNLVNQQMYEILAKMGIKAIPTIGREFDPNFHEAVAVEEREDFPDNYICQELVRGFCIGERVIRHSMVKVVKNSTTAVEINAPDVVSEEALEYVYPPEHENIPE